MDLSGAEWQIVAFLSEDPKMMEVCRGTESPHTITGALISGLSHDLIKAENELLEHETDPAALEKVRAEKLPEILEAPGFLPRSMTVRQAGKKSAPVHDGAAGRQKVEPWPQLWHGLPAICP
jgi:hypothetical protein